MRAIIAESDWSSKLRLILCVCERERRERRRETPEPKLLESGRGAFLWAGLPHTRRAGDVDLSGACTLGNARALLSLPSSRLLRIEGKVSIVDRFQTSHICILDIFISLKCVLIFIRKL